MPTRTPLPTASPREPGPDASRALPSQGAPSRRIALLRGVNVGGKKIAMADLRRVAESLGFGRVSTLINSGNLVYEAAATGPADDAMRLHDAIAHTLGVRCTVFVRTSDDVAAMLRECPLNDEARDHPSRLLVTLWNEHVSPAMLDAFARTPVAEERFVVGAHALYCWLPHGISASVPYEKAARQLGEHITARNWSTMQKLFARLQEAGE